MFFDIKKTEVVEAMPAAESGAHGWYVINIVQHEKAEKPLRADMEYWLHRFIDVAVVRRAVCSGTKVQMVG